MLYILQNISQQQQEHIEVYFIRKSKRLIMLNMVWSKKVFYIDFKTI